MKTNQARTTEKWRSAGYYVEVTEHISRIVGPAPGRVRVRRKDLHGFADCVALNGREIVYLQPTSWDNVHNRLRKIRTESVGKGQWKTRMRTIALMLLRTGVVRIVIEGWRQNKKSLRWEVKERELTLEEVESWQS